MLASVGKTDVALKADDLVVIGNQFADPESNLQILITTYQPVRLRRTGSFLAGKPDRMEYRYSRQQDDEIFNSLALGYFINSNTMNRPARHTHNTPFPEI